MNDNISSFKSSYTFIFPKFFEFYKFLNYVWNFEMLKDYEYNSIEDFYIFHLIIREKKCLIKIIVINDSDINFNTIVRRHIELNRNTIICLIGSCGSHQGSDLQEIFLIKKSFKVDRDTLDAQNVFEPRMDKILKVNSRTNFDIESRMGLKKKNICSMNFLNESIIHNDFINDLYDMETYDFYSICKDFNVQTYFSIRFVTDLVSAIGHSFEYNDYISKFERYTPLIFENEKEFKSNGNINLFKKVFRLTHRVDFKNLLWFDFDSSDFNSEKSKEVRNFYSRMTQQHRILVKTQLNKIGIDHKLTEKINNYYNSQKGEYKQLYKKYKEENGKH